MFLNETKPPLEEALAHYGVLGMRWGKRRSNNNDYDDYDSIERQERQDLRRRRMVAGGVVVAGTVATLAILQSTGRINLTPSLIAAGKTAASKLGANTPGEERRRVKDSAKKIFNSARSVGNEYDDAYRDAGRRAYGAYKNSKAAKRTFRPANVGNPLWTKNPKIFNVTTMASGSRHVRDFDPDIWGIPMLALTSGRKKR